MSSKIRVISRKVASIEREREREGGKKEGKRRNARSVSSRSPDGRKKGEGTRGSAPAEKPENQILILSYARVERHAMPVRLY